MNNMVLPPTGVVGQQPAVAGTGAMQPVMEQQPAQMQPTQMQPTQMQPQMMPPVEEMPPEMPPPEGPVLALDECDIDTGFPGDEFCIKPPPEGMGFQMHVGPSNYENPEQIYVLRPNQELTENFSVTSGNTEDIYYYWRQYRMRPGSHHLIITASGGSGGMFGGRRLGGTSSSARDNPEAGIIAPENEGVGMPLDARTTLSNSFHTYNFTEGDSLKEAWVNFWYRDPNDVTEPANEIFSMLGMGIPPGQHIVKRGTCDISGAGRLLTVYGHVHAHNKRFSVWRIRGGERLHIHDAYDWEHPYVSDFSSTTTNNPLDMAAKLDGGFSGVVDLKPGDKIEFECDIVNDTNTTFLGANEAENDEMCIMIGDTAGTNVPAFCAASDVQPY